MIRVPIYVIKAGETSPTRLFVEPSRPGATVRFMTDLENVRIEFPDDSPFSKSTIEIPRSEPGSEPLRLDIRRDADPGHYEFDLYVGESKDPGEYQLSVETKPRALREVGVTVYENSQGVGVRMVVPAFPGNAQVLAQFQPDTGLFGGPVGSPVEADASCELERTDTGEFLAQVTLPKGQPMMNFILDPGVQGNKVRVQALGATGTEQSGGGQQIDIDPDPLDP